MMRRRPNPKRVRRRMRRQRHIRQMRAVLGGYFWLPCPRCGTEYGGHEWVGRFNIVTEVRVDDDGLETGHMSTGMCPGCEAEMGLIGFSVICKRSGHEWTWRTRGKRVSGGPGHATISLDMSDREWYCANCGVDRPSTSAVRDPSEDPPASP